jgi:hypothetical protein
VLLEQVPERALPRRMSATARWRKATFLRRPKV